MIFLHFLGKELCTLIGLFLYTLMSNSCQIRQKSTNLNLCADHNVIYKNKWFFIIIHIYIVPVL